MALKGRIGTLEKVYDLIIENFGIAAYNINVGNTECKFWR